MSKLTIGFGVLLILLAGIGFISTGSAHPTALIPVGFGILFIIFGVLANTPDPRRRMLWMHISVTLALLAFLSTITADVQAIKMSHGTVYPHPAAVLEKAAMSLFSLIYVLFCVRSFIQARVKRA